MGEINFLTNEEEDKGKKKKTGDEPKEKKTGGLVGSFFAGKSDDLPINKEEEKERIEKSREEVLEMLHNDPKAQKDKNIKKDVAGEVVKDSWLKRLFSQKEDVPLDKKIDKDKGVSANSESPLESPKPLKKSPEVPDALAKKLLVQEGDSSLSPGAGTAANSGAQLPDKSREDKPFIFNTNTWQNSGVIATNLIDKSDYTFFDSGKKIKYITVGIFGAVFVVVASYAGLLYWENTELEKLSLRKAEVSILEVKVKQMENGIVEAQDFQGRLALVEKLIDKHIYWNNFFDFLEEKTLPNVYFTEGFSANLDGLFDLRAQTEDYESVKNQLIVLARDERISNLDLTSIQAFSNKTLISEEEVAKLTAFGEELTNEKIYEIDEGVDFSIKFEINNDIFLKKYSEEMETIEN